MPQLEPEYECDLITVEDDARFRGFAAKNPIGLEMIAEEYGDPKQVAMKSDAGDFVKWLRAHDPSINVMFDAKAPRLLLHSSDVWLPLAFLAGDIALPIYLNLVASYLYEKMKGALRGEIARVHLCAEFEDKASGTIKRFNFVGDAETLQKTLHRLGMDEFFDDR